LAFATAAWAQTLVASPESFRTPEFNANWGLGAIGAEYAYSLGFTGAGIKLGIADETFQLSHPEFAGRIYYPSNFPIFPVPGFPVPEHGTHVMGTAGAARNNEGMMGVAFDASLVGVVSLDSEGYPEAGDWAAELLAAGVSVMNGSFGPVALPPMYFNRDPTRPNPDFREIGFQALLASAIEYDLNDIKRLSEADVVMVFAAGNDYEIQPAASRFPLGFGMIPLIDPETTRAEQPNCDIDSQGLYCFLVNIDSEDYPYNPTLWEYESVQDVDHLDGSIYAGTLIAVVAVDRNNDMGDFSNRCGEAADWCMAAPGVDIYATVPISTYAGGPVWDGTSMAAPHVAGGAALVRQAFPYMTARQVIEVILTTATDLGDPAIYGHGLLNLERAVKGPIEFGHPSLIDGNDSIFAATFAVDTKGYDSVWSNDISGTGGFSKAGAGMLTLTGENTYSGDTTITGGILRVNGSIARSDLTVAQAATLQGIGTVGNTLLAGVLSPGNSVGTLTVQGNLTLQDGSTYLYEIDANQNGDLVVVTGTTTIADGAIFELSAEDGVYLDQLYPMIQSGTLNGTFETISTNYTFIDLDFIASTTAAGSELGMVVERNTAPMSSFAQTNNQRAVANAIDSQSGLAEPYNDVILNDNPNLLPGWYQDWSGEIYSANQAALLYNSRLVAQVVNWRLQDSWLGDSVARLQQVGQTNADTTVWAQAYGNWDKFSADENAQKATANSGGFVLGVDHQVSPSLRLGGGFSASVTDTKVAASSAGTSGYHLLAYGTYDTSYFRLNGGLVQSWYTANVNRTLPLDDQGNASGTVASRSTQLFADLSTPITLHKREDIQTTLWPFGQVSQTWLNTSNFGETGAEAALSGQATNASVGFGTLGARLAHQWQSQETTWQASFSAGWQRAWGDLSPTTTLAFATGPDFTVTAAPIAKDAAVIELGIGASLGPSSRFNLVYSATIANQSNSQMLQAQLQWWF
jgi:subtilase-type serine protease